MNERRPRILVVDDTEATRYAVVRTLASGGFDTIDAANGKDALELARTEIPDLITLDIHLPDINGFEVCRKIKADPTTSHIPVLQVSASYVTARDRIHGLEGGADSYLTHPFEPPVLLATIKSLLRSRRLVEDLRVAEKEQKQAAEEALLANEAKSRFLSNMSHEIRTPLGIIQGFADLALNENISVSERNEYLKTIQKNADSLTKLLGDILDLSKIEAGKVEIEAVDFDLTEILRDSIATFSLRTSETNVRLIFKPLTEFPRTVNSDPTRVRQILINLLSNAIKFTAGGEVTLEVRSSLTADGLTLVTIGVRDTGLGLDSIQSERLFQPFVQADASTTRKFGGTGLGLALSKKLATALGGDLKLVESTPNKGSLFEFSFSAGHSSISAFTMSLDLPTRRPFSVVQTLANSLVGLKILLVDDSEDNQILFMSYLKIAGAHVEVASDGLQGVEYASLNKYDVILMDLQMPVMDGYTATKELRANGNRTPIIALTAYALREQWEKALLAGCTDIITKPVNPKQLIEKLKNLTLLH